MSDPREFNTDLIMMLEYDQMQQEVSNRKLVSLELQQERDLTLMLQAEIKSLKQHLNRIENERDYYQTTSKWQGV